MTNNRRYVFSSVHFTCGCAYRLAMDTAIRCPTHGGHITRTQTIYTDTPSVPDLPGLVMNQYFKDTARSLYNTGRNSLHTEVTVRDGDQQEWETYQDLVGLCPACYIDHQEFTETRIAACECADDNCYYRWCGSLTGLHAFWRLHARGLSQERTGIPETDIFSHGVANLLPTAVQATLDAEREALTTAGTSLLTLMDAFRESNTMNEQDPLSPYESAWLDKEYADMSDDTLHSRQRSTAQASLIRKLTRFMVAGIIEATTQASLHPSLQG